MNKQQFENLYSLDVSQYVEEKQGLSYLSWAYAWREFKKFYPDAVYTVVKDEHNRCYFGDENIGYMVYTTVTAGGLTYGMWLPVMDGANKAMKLSAYEYTVKNPNFKYAKKDASGVYRDKYGNEQPEYIVKRCEAISMFDVNKTVMRCLVKNLAMFGLGLYIYAGEDLPEDIRSFVCEECGVEITANMAERTQKAFGKTLCKSCGLKHAEQNKGDKK